MIKFYTFMVGYYMPITAFLIDENVDYSRVIIREQLRKVFVESKDVLSVEEYPFVTLPRMLKSFPLDDSDIDAIEQVPMLCIAAAYTKDNFFYNNEERLTAAVAKSPKYAYDYARVRNTGPDDITRKAVCRDSRYAVRYAVEVEKSWHPDTLEAVKRSKRMLTQYIRKLCSSKHSELVMEAVLPYPELTYIYALRTGYSCDALRDAACKDPDSAYYYALYIDKCPRDDTREAVCKDPYLALLYAENVDRGPHEKTKAACLQVPRLACAYGIDVERKPNDKTGSS